MYREPHLQKKSEECTHLWYSWKKLWDIDMHSEETERARDMWSKCCDEMSEMVSHEVKTNIRYKSVRKI